MTESIMNSSNGAGKITAQRRLKYLTQLEKRGTVRVVDLAQAFNVSEITVRRDLDELAREGLVERFHGGARLVERLGQETLFEDKPRLHAVEKDVIGAVAADFVKDDQTVLLNGGTTSLAILRHLKNRNIRIVTNNAAAPAELGESAAELILLGGQYRNKSRSLYGDLALLALSQVHASLCILGSNGVSARTGLTTSVYAETAINRMMVERCKGDVIVVADGSKIGATSNFAGVPLEQVSVLITDSTADEEELNALRATGLRVIVCQVDAEAIPAARPHYE
jgi:DeoR/GlpR family transcriptional regulator of sugar metabolism